MFEYSSSCGRAALKRLSRLKTKLQALRSAPTLLRPLLLYFCISQCHLYFISFVFLLHFAYTCTIQCHFRPSLSTNSICIIFHNLPIYTNFFCCVIVGLKFLRSHEIREVITCIILETAKIHGT